MKLLTIDVGATEIKSAVLDESLNFSCLSVAGRRRYLPRMEIVRSQFGNDANLIGAFLTYQKVTDNN
ncbi:MAG: hypothetical protein IKX74_08025 [Erysipelotrichaceae bacterium]|nr:hypothetical protein [Erysipelotrichaceae bacterium]MBR5049567.1 hypothetical protein [Erysipelotrichaceae bacterium]